MEPDFYYASKVQDQSDDPNIPQFVSDVFLSLPCLEVLFEVFVVWLGFVSEIMYMHNITSIIPESFLNYNLSTSLISSVCFKLLTASFFSSIST